MKPCNLCKIFLALIWTSNLKVLAAHGEAPEQNHLRLSSELSARGEHRAALTLLRDAVKSGSSGDREADYLIEMGRIYTDLKNYDSAAFKYESALGLMDKNSAESRSLRLRLGILCFYDLSDFQVAERWLTEAWEAYRQAGDTLSRDFGRSNYMLTTLNNQKGDYERAIIYGNKAWSVFSDPAVNDRLLAFNIRIMLANIHYNRRQWSEAGLLYEHLLSQAMSEKDVYGNRILAICNNYGALKIQTADYNHAAVLLRTGLNTATMSSVPDVWELSYLYLNLAELNEKLGLTDSAAFWHRQSIDLREQHLGPHHIETQRALRLYGLFHEQGANYDSALYYYQQALAAMFPGFSPSDEYQSPTLEWLYRDDIFYIVFYKARALVKRYFENGKLPDLFAAIELYAEAYRLIDEARRSEYFEESKLDIAQVFGPDLRLSIHSAYALHRLVSDTASLNLCFEWIEKNKYALLLQSLERASARSSLGVPDSLRRQEQKLNALMASLKRDLTELKADQFQDSSARSIQEQILEAARQLDLLRFRLASDHPNYYQLKFGEESPSVIDFQKNVLKSGQLMLQYFQADSILYLISISNQGSGIEAIPIDDRLRSELSSLLMQVARGGDPANPSASFGEFCRSSAYLYSRLVMPAMMGPAGVAGKIRKIVVIPDNMLSSLPFEVLLTEQTVPEQIDYRNLPYLIKKMQLSYAYSAQLLHRTAGIRRDRVVKPILAMSFSADDEMASGTRGDVSGRELPHSAAELRSIAAHMKRGHYYAGSNATESVFWEKIGGAGLLHLALHGIADTVNALNSHLEFRDAGDSGHDGYLYAYELYDLDLSALRLAVLSACETGIGRQIGGEGIFSIARAFAYAGCPALVMSLWRVSDLATARLMDTFYLNLSRGKGASESLHQAKIRFLETSDEYAAHPVNWAAFIAINAPDAEAHRNTYLALAAVFVLVSIFFIYRHRGLRKLNKQPSGSQP